MPSHEPRRVLLLGAETPLGAAVAQALAAADMRLALVSASADAEAAFRVQRLARKLAATAQAIDAANEAAVRVMVRQVAKEMGGLDAIVFAGDLGPRTAEALAFAARFGGRELARSGGGRFVAVGEDAAPPSEGVEVKCVVSARRAPEEVGLDVVAAVADTGASR